MSRSLFSLRQGRLFSLLSLVPPLFLPVVCALALALPAFAANMVINEDSTIKNENLTVDSVTGTNPGDQLTLENSILRANDMDIATLESTNSNVFANWVLLNDFGIGNSSIVTQESFRARGLGLLENSLIEGGEITLGTTEDGVTPNPDAPEAAHNNSIICSTSRGLFMYGGLRAWSGNSWLVSLKGPMVIQKAGASQERNATLSLWAFEYIRATRVNARNLQAAYLFVDTDMSLKDGSLLLTGDPEYVHSIVGGNLTLTDMRSSIPHPLAVMGSASITGGTFQGTDVYFGQEATFSGAHSEIGNLKAGGALNITNNAILKITGSLENGENPVHMDSAVLVLPGAFSFASLDMDNQSLLYAPGDLEIRTQNFSLDGSALTGKAKISLAGFDSRGSSLIKANSDVIINGEGKVESGATYIESVDGNINVAGLSGAEGAELELYAPKGAISASGNIQASAINAQKLEAAADVAIHDGSLNLAEPSAIQASLDLRNSSARVSELSVNGAATVDGGSVAASRLTLNGGAGFANSAMVTVNELAASGNVSIQDGSSLLADSISLGENSLVLASSGQDRSQVAANSLAGGFQIGQSSLLSLGSANFDWLARGHEKLGSSASLGIASPFILAANSGGSVGASARFAGGQLNFGTESLLLTNVQSGLSQQGAISAQTPTRTNVADGAHLHIMGDVIKDTEYRILGDNLEINYEGAAWEGANATTDSHLLRLERLSGDRLGWVKVVSPGADSTLPDLSPDLRPPLDNGSNNGTIRPEPPSVPTPPVTPPVTPDTPPALPPDTPVTPPDTPEIPPVPPITPPDTPGTEPDTPDTPEPPLTPPVMPGPPSTPDEPVTPPVAPETPPMASRPYTPGQLFISRATNLWFIGRDARLAAITLESAARILVLGGVPQMTFGISDSFADIVQARSMDRQEGGLLSEDLGDGMALWISPLYGSRAGNGLNAGSFSLDYSGNFGGLALGADWTRVNNDYWTRLGIAAGIGAGYSRSYGALAKTQNSLDFWGLSIYGGLGLGDFGLYADVDFVSTYNKVKQDVPRQMRLNDLKSDITSRAIGVELRADYRLRSKWLDFLPHVGARYAGLQVDNYAANSNGCVLEGDAVYQNVWTFPLGVSLEKDFYTEGGWKIMPRLNLEVVPAAGQLKTDYRVGFTGVPPSVSLDTQIMDNITYGGGAGLYFEKDSFSIGVAWDGRFGSHTSAQAIYGTLMWEF